MFFLNASFPGSVMHHVEERVGVFVPEGVNRVPHDLATGRGMVEVNELAAAFLGGLA